MAREERNVSFLDVVQLTGDCRVQAEACYREVSLGTPYAL